MSARETLALLIEAWHREYKCPLDCECDPAGPAFKGFVGAQADVLAYELVREWQERDECP